MDMEVDSETGLEVGIEVGSQISPTSILQIGPKLGIEVGKEAGVGPEEEEDPESDLENNICAYARINRRLKNPPPPPSENPEIKLTEAQVHGIECMQLNLKENGISFLNLPIGYGKSAALMYLVYFRRSQGMAYKACVIVPSNIVDQWERDLLDFFNGCLTYHVMTTNRDQIKPDVDITITTPLLVKKIVEAPRFYDILAIDEFSALRAINMPFITFPCIILSADTEIPLEAKSKKVIIEERLKDKDWTRDEKCLIYVNGSLLPARHDGFLGLRAQVSEYRNTTFTKRLYDFKEPFVKSISVDRVNKINKLLGFDKDEYNRVLDQGYTCLVEDKRKAGNILKTKWSVDFQEFIDLKIKEFKDLFSNINTENSIIFWYYFSEVLKTCNTAAGALLSPTAEKIMKSSNVNVQAHLRRLENIKQRYVKTFENGAVCDICSQPREMEMLSCCQNLLCEPCKVRIEESSGRAPGEGQCPYCRGHLVLFCLGQKELSLDEVMDNKDNRILFVYYEDPTVFETYLAHREFIVLGGTYRQRLRQLSMYRNGHIKILLLRILDDISGLRLETTTDIILLHKLSDDQYNQLIGRVLRLGRDLTMDLRVYKVNW